MTFFDEHIAVTDAAGLNLDANLVAAWLGDGALDDFEVGPGLRDFYGFHGFRHGVFSLGWFRSLPIDEIGDDRILAGELKIRKIEKLPLSYREKYKVGMQLPSLLSVAHTVLMSIGFC